MADLKINGVTPLDIKLGSLSVTKIYQGTTLVWPIISFPTMTIETISQTEKVIVISPLYYTGVQNIYYDYEMIASSFGDPGVTNVEMYYPYQGFPHLFYTNDTGSGSHTFNQTTGEFRIPIKLLLPSINDTCTIRVTITNMTGDDIPIPNIIDVSLSNFPQ